MLLILPLLCGITWTSCFLEHYVELILKWMGTKSVYEIHIVWENWKVIASLVNMPMPVNLSTEHNLE